MKFLIILAAIVCVVALVVTLILTKADDTNYSSNKSINNQLFMYLALIPIIAMIIVISWVFVF